MCGVWLWDARIEYGGECGCECTSNHVKGGAGWVVGVEQEPYRAGDK